MTETGPAGRRTHGLPPALCLLLCATLAGCGQTGPLVLPGQMPPAAEAPSQSANDPEAAADVPAGAPGEDDEEDTQ